MSERRRILFLAPFPPDPDGSHGGARAIGQMIDQLAGRHDAAVLHMRAPGEAPMPGYLKERLALAEEVARPDRQSTHARRAVAIGRALARVPAGTPAWVSDWCVPAFARRLAEIAGDWRPDVVQSEFHVMGQYLSPAAGAARVLVEHEAGAAAAAELAAWEPGVRGLARRVDAAAWRRYERRAIAGADATVALTDRDRAHLAALAPGARIVRIPLGVRTPERALDPVGTDPPRIVFVGNFMHPPNVQAALDLAGSIFPIVSARHPEATLELIGDRPPPALLQLAGPQILVHGSVPDPTSHLDRAALVVVPARLGGGMRVKVLDTLAAGKALVATGRALAGIDLESGTHALVAESDFELAGRIGELLDDPERRGRVAAAGRALVAERLSWDAAGRAYTELYESLLAEALTVDRGRKPTYFGRPMRFGGLPRRRRRVTYGSLRRLTPISDRWGLDRGTPVDRHYIEQFLGQHAEDVRGRVLEIGDSAYTRRFGGAVERVDVFDVDAGNPDATIVGDLSRPDALPEGTFDCAIITQTLHLIYDFPAALASLRRSLKPGGVLLLTIPGITRRGADHDYGATWHWSFTSVSARRMCEEVFGSDAVTVSAYGNVLTAVAFLHGVAAEELESHELSHRDPRYEVTVAVRASAT